MSLQTYAWIVLLAPLAGAIFIGLHVPPAAVEGPRLDRHAGHRALLPRRGRRAVRAPGPARGGAPGRQPRVELRQHRRRRRPALAADRPAVRVHDPLGLRRLGADPPLLGRLHGVRRRLRAVLRVPELLRLLDAAAGPGRQLRDPDRRLGLRRRGLLPADLVLVPARDGDEGGHQGVRHQRGRRRRPRARDVLHLQARRVARLPQRVRARGRVPVATTATSSRAACCSSSAPSPSRRRSRSTPGSRTPWRARRRSPP